MQRRQFIREPSLAAKWALPPAVLSLVLLGVATLAHWTDLLASPNYVAVLFVAFALGLVAVVLSLLGFRALWKNASFGGRRSFFAMLMSLPTVGAGLQALLLSQITPRITDVTTDILNPPHFRFLNEVDEIINVLEPPKFDAQSIAEHEGVSGRRYALSADLVSGKVMEIVDVNGWKTTTPFPVRNGQTEWIIEALVRTPLLGFRDAIVVRVTEEGEAAYVDMRSASGYGSTDLGTNANRIRKFMTDLDTNISLGATRGQ